MISSNDDESDSIDELVTTEFDTDLDEYEALDYHPSSHQNRLHHHQSNKRDNKRDNKRTSIATTSETVKYVMDSILPDSDNLDDIDAMLENFEDDDDFLLNELEDEGATTQEEEESERKRNEVINGTITKRLAQMSKRLDAFKQRHHETKTEDISDRNIESPSLKHRSQSKRTTRTPSNSAFRKPEVQSNRKDNNNDEDEGIYHGRNINANTTLQKVLRETQEEVEKLRMTVELQQQHSPYKSDTDYEDR
jgi:hypothetical protein